MPETALTERGLARRIKRHLLAQEQTFYISAEPGFEEAVASEVRALGYSGGEISRGGVTLKAPFSSVYALNVQLRSASRVLMRIADFPVLNAGDVYNGVSKVCWERYLGFASSISFRATARRSRLRHTGRIEKSALDGIRNRMKQLKLPIAQARDAPLRIFLMIAEDHCTLSIDASGELLHKRGYRSEALEAPLRETIGAGILNLLDDAPGSTLVDPCCGSGTFAIEAALRRRKLPVGLARSFAFEHWPACDELHLERAKKEATAKSLPAPAELEIFASDRRETAVAATLKNAAAAGVAEQIQVERRDLKELLSHPAIGRAPGLILSNSPYGRRLAEKGKVRRLFRRLGKDLPKAFPGWSYAFLVDDEALGRELGFPEPPETRLAFKNGGLEVALLVGKVPGGEAPGGEA